MYKIALVDDHVLLRQGLASLINSSTDFTVLFEADNGKDFIDKLDPNNLPLLVLMDITMPEMNGYVTTNWLKINYPGILVLALSMMDDEIAVIQMLKNGASGFLLKNTKPSELFHAMNEVIKNGCFFNELVNNSLISNINKTNSEADDENQNEITDREKLFLQLNCSELSYKEIAEKMQIKPRTIDWYRDALFNKLKIKSRVGLVMYAIKNGIVEI